MSGFGDALRALRTVLLLQDDVARLKQSSIAQADQLARLADAHANLRDRVSRLEGVMDGVAIAARQRRIEE